MYDGNQTFPQMKILIKSKSAEKKKPQRILYT